jgi:methyl-accepting chemotaxis protein
MKGQMSIKDGYFGKFRTVADQMRRISAEGANNPMPLSQWVDTSTPLLATILDVMEGANAASEARTAEFQNIANRELITSAALLLLGVVLATVAAIYARFTIAKPIRALTAGMRELAQGNLSIALAGLGRKDEIGEIAGAVESFKIKAAERAQLEADEIMHRRQTEAEVAAKAQARIAEEQAKAAEIQAKAAEEQARALRTLAEGLSRLAHGDLTYRLAGGFTGA